MFKQIKKILLVTLPLSVLALGLVFVAPASPALAACEGDNNNLSGNLSAGVNSVTSGNANDCAKDTKADESKITSTAKTVVNILSLVIGAIAVIMIIVGGFRYITSAGDSGRITGAKNTIVYALIGLVVVVFAQLIVKFVLNKSEEVNTGATTTGIALHLDIANTLQK